MTPFINITVPRAAIIGFVLLAAVVLLLIKSLSHKVNRQRVGTNIEATNAVESEPDE